MGADGRKGIALVSVLWTIALVSALAMAASVSFRGFAGIIVIDRDRERSDLLLNAGLETSAGIILRLKGQPLTEREASISLSTGSVDIYISDETGRIDVNKAPVRLLAALLRHVGASEDAEAIAHAVVVWRSEHEPDQTTQTPYQPSNDPSGGQATQQSGTQQRKGDGLRPFTDVRQLGAVPGMTRDYVAAIMPLATTWGTDKINALTAPAEDLEVLPNLSQAQLATFIEARRNAMTEDWLKQLLGPAADYVTFSARSVASVQLLSRLPDGYETAVRAVIVAVTGDTQPYRVLAWTPMPVSSVHLKLEARNAP
jgi:general secretion pathway protein K